MGRVGRYHAPFGGPGVSCRLYRITCLVFAARGLDSL
jgi:hypothetical protein